MDRPDRCPFGHPLGPGQYSLSWDMKIKKHWLLCGACDRRTGIVLHDGAEWQIDFPGRGWVPYE